MESPVPDLPDDVEVLLGRRELDEALIEHGAVARLLDPLEQLKVVVIDDPLAGEKRNRNKLREK